MKLQEVHRVFFIGVGGIGMSALARWFMHYGKPVAGYDKTPTPLTSQLIGEGIDIHFEDDLSSIPDIYRTDKENTLVVYTPAIPVGHSELDYFRKEGFQVMKRSEVLGMISQDMYTIAIAGTHGKTTTSSMVTHLLKEGNVSFTALVGGIMSNYDSNLVVNGETPNVFVVEADEFDRSFLRLSPNIAVITSMDADHLDIYGHKDELKNSFKDFVAKLPSDGKLLYHQTLKKAIADFGFENVYAYGESNAEISSTISKIESGLTYFTFNSSSAEFDLSLLLPGRYNIDNATAATQVALDLGLNEEVIQKAFESYLGVKRRFEHVLKTDNNVLIDDYAHHPTEIQAFVSGVKSIYPNRKVTIIFQPHLYSRTKDFAAEFASSLSLADNVILLDIYPARELPIEGVSSAMIFDQITVDEKYSCTKEGLMALVEKLEFDVLCTVGAGDIDQFVIPIRDHLSKQVTC